MAEQMVSKTKKPTLKAQLARRDARIDLLENLLRRWCLWITTRPFSLQKLFELYEETRTALRDNMPDAS